MGYLSTGQGIRSAGASIAAGIRRRDDRAEKDRRYQVALQEAAQEQQERQAMGSATDFRLGELEHEAMGALGPEAETARGVELGVSPLAQGAQVDPVDRLARRFDQIRTFASRLPVEHQPRFLAEERAKLEAESKKRARDGIMDTVQERRARGGFAFEGENEVHPEIEARLDQIAELADEGQVEPDALQQAIDQVAEAVRTENQERLKIQRGDRALEDEMGKALAGGDMRYAEQMETIKSLWGTREIDFDDLVDRMFEAKHGRKTQRSSGPTPFELRKQALDIHMNTKGTMPTEAELQEIEALLAPPGARAGEAEAFSPLGMPPMAPGSDAMQQTLMQRFQSGDPTAGMSAGVPAANGAVVPRGTPEGAAAPAEPVAPPPQEALDALVEALRGGSDAAQAAEELGIDLESLPPEVQEALLAAVQEPAPEPKGRRARMKPAERMRTRGR